MTGNRDLIIKIFVNLNRVRKITCKVTELQNEYPVHQNLQEFQNQHLIGNFPEVEYARKTKTAVLSGSKGRHIYCINTVQDTPLLYGRGLLVAIIHSESIYANIRFRNADGSTRIFVCVGSVSESGSRGNSTGLI